MTSSLEGERERLTQWAYTPHATLGFSERQIEVQGVLSRVTELEEALRTRAEMWESKATEADAASESYRGHDVEAAVTLARDANRARNRAAELREILALAGVPATDTEPE